LLKIMIAEDDAMIASLTQDILVDHGYAVCGIANTVAAAVALARREQPDLAIIDLRLADDGLGTAIVAELGKLGKLGILYTTGSAQIVLTASDGHARLAKPFRDTELLRSLEIVAELVSSGLASPPFPRGFHLLPLAAARLP
jgi:DNA-binding response OmpR family regulator